MSANSSLAAYAPSEKIRDIDVAIIATASFRQLEVTVGKNLPLHPANMDMGRILSRRRTSVKSSPNKRGNKLNSSQSHQRKSSRDFSRCFANCAMGDSIASEQIS